MQNFWEGEKKNQSPNNLMFTKSPGFFSAHTNILLFETIADAHMKNMLFTRTTMQAQNEH